METVFGRAFTRDEWLKYGDLGAEIGRMRHMLSELPERGTPTACLDLMCHVLSCRSVLRAWKDVSCQLLKKLEEEIEWMRHEMYQQQQRPQQQQQQREEGNEDENCETIPKRKKLRYLAVPVDYRTDASAKYVTALLWKRSLLEITAQIIQGRCEDVRGFLQVFSFLKDPLGGLASVSEKAVDIFVHMINSLLNSGLRLSKAQWHAAATQVAQEALFLATPLLESVEYVHFAGHQQLPYAYVELDQLTRSEFSIPAHVMRIIEEILDFNGRQAPNHNYRWQS
ncbi:hypothetical protein TI39_contig4160g00001 [Zymoseptoria brevis]|uniref:Uncharacterized protein n=1 Tax=Zymoseptoria brevis TaxID=1047168 RepID=A0A0F4GEX7_9PEZI|nr:hypothetical protein TI39_contig4160g00001 [Zymoseptoria brevis]